MRKEDKNGEERRRGIKGEGREENRPQGTLTTKEMTESVSPKDIKEQLKTQKKKYENVGPRELRDKKVKC